MPRGAKEPHRHQQSFDAWWSQRYFFTNDPLYSIYKQLHFKGADLNFIDSLTRCLLFADSLDGWRREAGGKRRSDNVPTTGKLRKSIIGLSVFIASCVDPTEQGREKFSPEMKENLMVHLFMAYAANPDDFRAGGKSDRCGSFFLLVTTEHFRDRGVKPRYLLAARLLRKVRRQQSAPANLEATKAKARLSEFKKLTFDWQYRLAEFNQKLLYPTTT